MAWIYLVVAGLLEVGWTIGLKYSAGFTRPVASVLTVLTMIASMFLLSVAVRTLPIGTAYPVWVGIGALGAAVLGMILFGEPRSLVRVFLLALLMAAIVGLKLTATTETRGIANPHDSNT